MSWVAVATIGGGALIGGLASGYAANKQAGAAGNAAALQMEMYNQTRNDLAQYRKAGGASLASLQRMLGMMPGGGFDPNALLVKQFGLEDFQASPAYQFNLTEGQKAIDKAAAARDRGGKGLYAPATLQDISRYSQGLASNEFLNAYGMYRNRQQDIYGRYSDIATMGQNAAAMTGSAGAQAARGAGDALIGAGNARAAGAVGAANALQGGISDYYNYDMMNKILRRSPTYGGSYPAEAP